MPKFKVGDYFRFPNSGNVYRVDKVDIDHYSVTPIECNDSSMTLARLNKVFGMSLNRQAELCNEYFALKKFDKELEELLK
jgi:hypothetical protein